jgi:hypothetical protein
MRSKNLHSSSNCGQFSNHCNSINNTDYLSAIYFQSVQQTASECPNPDTASEWTVHPVRAAGSQQHCNWLTPYGCNWHLEAFKTRLQVSICKQRHMDNKCVSILGHDETGKSIFNKWNKCKVSIHMHLQTTVYLNITFDQSKRNKTLKHYLEFSIPMAILLSVVPFPQHM